LSELHRMVYFVFGLSTNVVPFPAGHAGGDVTVPVLVDVLVEEVLEIAEVFNSVDVASNEVVCDVGEVDDVATVFVVDVVTTTVV
jgi:hypothetical protein